VLTVLCCVSCRDPGLLERVTDEEAAENGWFWNEQVGSYRPAGAMYCRECKVSETLCVLAEHVGTDSTNKHLLYLCAQALVYDYDQGKDRKSYYVLTVGQCTLTQNISSELTVCICSKFVHGLERQ